MKSNFIHSLKHFVRTLGKDTPDGYGRIGYRSSRGEVLLVSSTTLRLTRRSLKTISDSTGSSTSRNILFEHTRNSEPLSVS